MIKLKCDRTPMSEKQIFVKLPNSDGVIELAYLTEQILNARNIEHDWQPKRWTPQPALIEINGGSSQLYHGQKYDPQYFNLVDDGWTHDHCLICFQTISNNSDQNEQVVSEGYTDQFNNWICHNCYSNFIQPKDYNAVLNDLKRIAK